jgi:hypothetical protein
VHDVRRAGCADQQQHGDGDDAKANEGNQIAPPVRRRCCG